MLLPTKAVELLVSGLHFTSWKCLNILSLVFFFTETPEARQARLQRDAATHQSSRASGK